MMDQSASITNTETGGQRMAFKFAKEFILALAQNLRSELEAGEVTVGLIDYTSSASMVIPLNELTSDVDAFQATVDAIRYQGRQAPLHGSNADSAFQLAREALLEKSHPGLAHVMLLSDGHVYAREFETRRPKCTRSPEGRAGGQHGLGHVEAHQGTCCYSRRTAARHRASRVGRSRLPLNPSTRPDKVWQVSCLIL